MSNEDLKKRLESLERQMHILQRTSEYLANEIVQAQITLEGTNPGSDLHIESELSLSLLEIEEQEVSEALYYVNTEQKLVKECSTVKSYPSLVNDLIDSAAYH